MSGHSDFVIIGGGLVGTAVAYGLIDAGASVTVLDEGDDAFRASRGNFGLVWVQSKGDGMPEYAAWSRESAGIWPTLAKRLAEEDGTDVGLRQPGGIDPCLDGKEYKALEASIHRMHNQPGVGENDSRMIDGDAAREMVPQLGPEVVGGRYSPHDGHCNPLHLMHGLHRNLQRRGVDYRPNHKARSIRAEGGGFVVSTDKGNVHGGKVVLAAGLGNGALAADVGLSVPTAPERGHILVTERLEPFLEVPVTRVRQTEEGSVMMGATAEDAGYDTTINFSQAAHIAARAVRTIPRLASAKVVRMWSALRIMSPDGFPIYEESREHPGVYVVTCHSGVTLAGAHALKLAPDLMSDNFNERYAAFSAGRFDV